MQTGATAVISDGLRVFLTVLRYELLATANIDRKIRICSAIHDCAYAGRLALRSAAFDVQVDCPEFFALIADIPSHMADKARLAILIAALDGFTTSIRIVEPVLAAVVRRTMEIVAALFSITSRAPKHLEINFAVESSPPQLHWPPIPDRPARPYGQDLDPKVQSDEILKSIHRKLLNIEIPAAEICAAIPLIYPDLPVELDLLLASQTYDEGRHAQQLLDALRRRQESYNPPVADFRIWDNMRLGQSLAEAICIEQILGEGYSIGTDLCLAHMFKERGQDDLAEIHTSVQEDEFMHAADGLAWFRKITGAAGDEIVFTLEPRFANEPPTEPWFREDLRLKAGFSKAQIHRQRMLARPVHF